ncbi:MAG: metallophosphoesterase family protein [Sulfitobacter sp.]|nr:metallophosphoesterase family protein [Sulfitobacter sp.]
MTYPLTAIISDLHGNTPALEEALRDAHARGVRRYVCLGDVVGYGAHPRYCLARVMGLVAEGALDPDGEPLEQGLCLLGNHEDALLFHADDFNPKARAAIEWTREEISRDEERSDEFWEFLGQLNSCERDDIAMFAHGSPRDPVREYILPRDAQDHEKMQANFDQMDREVCFIGHSHVPCIYTDDGRVRRPKDSGAKICLDELKSEKTIVNVGSVGQPRDQDPRLSYVLFDGECVTFLRLEYDHGQAADSIRSVPELPDFLADRLAQGR